MKKKTPPGDDLRMRAEEALESQEDSSIEGSGEQMRQLIHELRIHQVELEMQNEELRSAQARLEESRMRYADLYDFAPVGYFTFDDRGTIVEVNLTGAKKLRIERGNLIGAPFVARVIDREGFRSHLRKVFDTREGHTCELRVKARGGEELYARLDSLFVHSASGAGFCRSSLTDITEKKRAEEALGKSREELERRVKERTAELERANEELRAFPSRLIMAQEEERKRLASELHDSIGSSLAAVKFSLEQALSNLEQLKLQPDSIRILVAMTQQAIDDTRRMTMDLRPTILDDLGILTTIGWLCKRHQTIYSTIRLEQHIGIEEEEIPKNLKIVIFRIMQEALNNIAKYSQADRVTIALTRRDPATIELRIQDNGKGFDVQAALSGEDHRRGLGLTSMRERAEFTGGNLSISSTPGEGTRVRVWWPKSPDPQQVVHPSIS